MIRAIWENIKGLYSLLVGMYVTAGFFFEPRNTIHYPRKVVEKENVINYRGPLELTRGKTDPGQTRCISCQMCVKACPGHCIKVVKGKDSKAPSEWKYDFTLCCLCGACVEVCPTSAIDFSHRVYMVATSREQMNLDLLEDLKKRVEENPILDKGSEEEEE
jgi:NADH-quinone oxidoreductase subunit I